MTVDASLEITDRSHASGEDAVDIVLWLRGDGKTEQLLLSGTGVVSRDDDFRIEDLKVSRNELRLPLTDAIKLLKATCMASWNSIITGECVAIATHWKPLSLHLEGIEGRDELLALVESKIGNHTRQ